MKWIGFHVSAAGGLHNAAKNASIAKADAFALFTKNQRQWSCTDLQQREINEFKAECKNLHFPSERILPHGSYLINLANPTEQSRTNSISGLLTEVQRCQQLGLKLYNFHPGSTCGLVSVEEGCELVAQGINHVLKHTQDVTIVIENAAGQGNSVGSQFEELRSIINRVDDQGRIGVCIDTCHAFAAGYDIGSLSGYERTFQQFSDIVGWNFLKGIHLNDSKTPLNSGKDRHEKIGQGHIGLGAFHRIMNDSNFDNIPIILETPGGYEKDASRAAVKARLQSWADEVAVLRAMIAGPAPLDGQKLSENDFYSSIYAQPVEYEKYFGEIRSRKRSKSLQGDMPSESEFPQKTNKKRVRRKVSTRMHDPMQ